MPTETDKLVILLTKAIDTDLSSVAFTSPMHAEIRQGAARLSF